MSGFLEAIIERWGNKLKPGLLVRVIHPDYSHVGEIISRPTPDGTIMVRQVPGDPMTMIEMPITDIVPTTGKYKWVQYAEIDGSFSFPVDMLRYDYCAPATFSLIEERPGWLLKPNETKLIVGRAVKRKGQEWTSERWSSFSLRIKPLSTLPIVR